MIRGGGPSCGLEIRKLHLQNVLWHGQVYTTKDTGGLGIRDFGTHNICLLLNIVHCLYCASSSAWGLWIKQHVDLSNLNSASMGTHWDLLRSLLPLYQALTAVQLGDGKSTSLWSDVWFEDDALTDRFPRLFSHCTKDFSVHQAISTNLEDAFVNRLSVQAREELDQFRQITQHLQLCDSPDVRTSSFESKPDKLDTSAIYRILKERGQPAEPASAFIWQNAAPPRVQLFTCFLYKGRIQCRKNLYRKRILDSQFAQSVDKLKKRPNTLFITVLLQLSSGPLWECSGIMRSTTATFTVSAGSATIRTDNTMLLSFSATGSCGRGETDSSSVMKLQISDNYFCHARTRQSNGEPDSQEKIRNSWMIGVD